MVGRRGCGYSATMDCAADRGRECVGWSRLSERWRMEYNRAVRNSFIRDEIFCQRAYWQARWPQDCSGAAGICRAQSGGSSAPPAGAFGFVERAEWRAGRAGRAARRRQGAKDKTADDPNTTRLKIVVTNSDDKPVGNASVYVRFNEAGGFLHKEKLAEMSFQDERRRHGEGSAGADRKNSDSSDGKGATYVRQVVRHRKRSRSD